MKLRDSYVIDKARTNIRVAILHNLTAVSLILTFINLIISMCFRYSSDLSIKLMENIVTITVVRADLDDDKNVQR